MHFHGFDVYRTFLAMKQHFSNQKFDFFQYDGKVRANETTYQQRNDFYFFETLARKLSAVEVKEYLLASFVNCSDPKKLWIGDIKRNGKEYWTKWQKQNTSLRYNVEQDLNNILLYKEKTGLSFNDLFSSKRGHPPVLRMYIKGDISLETLVILDMVLKFIPRWDRDMDDPLWNPLSLKIKKYKPFLSIPVKSFKELMQEKFL